jgi:hypothetical protein
MPYGYPGANQYGHMSHNPHGYPGGCVYPPVQVVPVAVDCMHCDSKGFKEFAGRMVKIKLKKFKKSILLFNFNIGSMLFL